MKKTIKITIVLLSLIAIIYLICRSYAIYQLKKEIQSQIQAIPDTEFINLYGIKADLKGYAGYKPIVIIYFHPECELCQYEAQEIIQNAEAFKDYQLIFITPDDSIPRIGQFCQEYHLWELENLEVLLDRNNKFKETFGKAILPSIYIYNKQGILAKTYLGETKPGAIIATLKEQSVPSK